MVAAILQVGLLISVAAPWSRFDTEFVLGPQYLSKTVKVCHGVLADDLVKKCCYGSLTFSKFEKPWLLFYHDKVSHLNQMLVAAWLYHPERSPTFRVCPECFVLCCPHAYMLKWFAVKSIYHGLMRGQLLGGKPGRWPAALRKVQDYGEVHGPIDP